MAKIINDATIEAELIDTQVRLISGSIHPQLPEVLEQYFPGRSGAAYLLHAMPDQGGEVFWGATAKPMSVSAGRQMGCITRSLLSSIVVLWPSKDDK